MNIKPIRSRKDLREALARIDEIIDSKYGTPEYDELEVLSTLLEAYEEKHCPIPPPDQCHLKCMIPHVPPKLLRSFRA